MVRTLLICLLLSGAATCAMAQCSPGALCGLNDFTLATPAPANVSNSTVSLSWSDAIAGSFSGEEYNVEYRTPAAASWTIVPRTTSLSKTVASLVAGETYEFRVQASALCVDTGETECRYSNTITVTLDPPVPVVLAGSDKTSVSFVANWQAAKGATKHLVKVMDDMGNPLPAYNGVAVTAACNCLSIVGLTPLTQYFYEVAAENTNGTSSYSQSNMGVLTLASPPTLQANNITFQNVGETSLQVSWTKGNGASRLLVVNESAAVSFVPLAGSSYSGNADYALATVDAATGNRILYNGTGNSVTVTNLSRSKTYHFRLFEFNGNTTVSNYLTTEGTDNPLSKTTLAATPVAQPASLNFLASSESTLQFSFTASSSASGYLVLRKPTSSPTAVPVDGTVYTAGNTLGDSKIVAVVANGSPITDDGFGAGLTPGTLYHYDIFSFNGTGAATNYLTTSPLEGNRTTLAREPDVAVAGLSFPDITTTSLSITFTAPSDVPDSYLILRKGASTVTEQPQDGKQYTVGESIGGAIVVAAGPASGTVDTQLNSGTQYYYAVFCFNGSGATANYLTDGVTASSSFTAPVAPQLSGGQTNQTSVEISWSAISGCSYVIEASTSPSFVPLLSGYPKSVAAGTTNFYIDGLTPATFYYARIKAEIGGVPSAYSNPIIRGTNDPTGGDVNLRFLSAPVYPASFDATGPMPQVTVATSGGIGSVQVFFHYRSCTATEYTMTAMPGSNGAYSITLNDEWFDEMGLEFFVSATDGSATPIALYKSAATMEPYSLVRKIPSVEIPVDRFGTNLRNYQIISLPFLLDGEPTLESLFSPIDGLGEYDESRWRLVKYENGGNKDYARDGLKTKRFIQGQGYWFICDRPVSLVFGSGTTVHNSTASPVVMRLGKGWNQIGNPLPFDVSWNQILADNGNPEGVGPFLEFDFANISFKEGDVIKVFSGGFVHSDEEREILVRTTLTRQAEGGRAGGTLLNSTTGYEGWFLPLSITSGEVTNTLPGIGMVKNASRQKDQYDLPTPPRLGLFADMQTTGDRVQGLTRDIVDVSDDFTWEFLAASGGSAEKTIEWDKALVAQLPGNLILHDVGENVLIDMASADAYHFNASEANIRLYYSLSSDLGTESINLGHAYPNPTSGNVYIPIDYVPGADYNASARLTVFDHTGRIVYQSDVVPNREGNLKEIIWDGNDIGGRPCPAGVYLFKAQISQSNGSRLFQGKLVIH